MAVNRGKSHPLRTRIVLHGMQCCNGGNHQCRSATSQLVCDSLEGWLHGRSIQTSSSQPFRFTCKYTRDYQDVVKLCSYVSFVQPFDAPMLRLTIRDPAPYCPETGKAHTTCRAGDVLLAALRAISTGNGEIAGITMRCFRDGRSGDFEWHLAVEQLQR